MPDCSPTVVLTRSEADNAPLAERLAQHGIETISAATVAMAWLAPAQGGTVLSPLLAAAPAIVFTSRYGVMAWCAQAGSDDLQAALSRGAEVAVVGQGTAAALRAHGVTPTLIADPATGGALAAQLLDRLPTSSTAAILAMQGAHARPELREGLVAGGRVVETVVVYENRQPPPPADELLLACACADAIYVAAPSAAGRLLAWSPGLIDRSFVAIGPTTATTLAERHGIVAAAVAENPGIDAVEAAIVGLIDVRSQP